MSEIKDTIDGLLSDYHRVRIELERTEKELEVHKKALKLACIDIASSHPILSSLGFDFYNDRYMKKVRDDNV